MQRKQVAQSMCNRCQRWIDIDQANHHMRMCDGGQVSHSHTPHSHPPNPEVGFHMIWPGQEQPNRPRTPLMQRSPHAHQPTPPRANPQQSGGGWFSWIWGGAPAQQAPQNQSPHHGGPQMVCQKSCRKCVQGVRSRCQRVS